MKKYCRHLSVGTVIIVILLCLSAYASDIHESVVFYDGLELKGELEGGQRFFLCIDMMHYNKDIKEKPSKFWGFDKDYPTYVIKKLTLTVDGKKVIIPPKAIEDIADIVLPYGVFLMQKGKDVLLHVKGGDGAGAYHATFTIKRQRVVSRVISFINTEGLDMKEMESYADH